MLDRRMSMLPFLLAMVVLAVVGFFATTTALASSRAAGIAVGVVLYALQVPLVRWRLNDLGRSPDDLVWLLVPGFGQVFIFALLKRTPSDKVHAKRVRHWQGQISGVGAFLLGLRRLARVWWLALPLALLFGVVETLVGEELLDAVGWIEGLPAPTRLTLFQGLAVLAGILAVYSLMQVFKRRKATRLSWMPSLFMLPVGLVAGTVYLAGVPSTEPARLALAYSAWGLLFACIAGASLAVAWITLGQQLEEGEVDAMAVVRRVFARTADVAAPHGAKVHAVQIGLQVVVPGIFYAVQMAFVDMAAVLEPEGASLRRSARLSWGIRTRVLKALLLGVLVSLSISLSVTYYFEGKAGVMQGLIVPGSIGLWPTLVGDVTGILVFGAVTMGLLQMYRERVERVSRQKKSAIPEEREFTSPILRLVFGSVLGRLVQSLMRAKEERPHLDETRPPVSPDATPPGSRQALVFLGLLMVGLGVVLYANAGTGAAMVSGGLALAVLALFVGGSAE